MACDQEGDDGVSHEKREETELIQVMAVACGSLEVMRYGQAAAEAMVMDEAGEPITMQAFGVLDDVEAERVRQDAKWGEQNHGRISWAMILAEEIGEWAAELRVTDEEMPESDKVFAQEVIDALIAAGEGARIWLESHEWPERQQRVYDEEVG